MTLQQSPSPSAPHAPATAAIGHVSPDVQQPVAATPSQWLRDLRTRIGWTQDDLALRIKSDRAVISRLENGKRSLTSGFRSRIMVAVRQAERGR